MKKMMLMTLSLLSLIANAQDYSHEDVLRKMNVSIRLDPLKCVGTMANGKRTEYSSEKMRIDNFIFEPKLEFKDGMKTYVSDIVELDSARLTSTVVVTGTDFSIGASPLVNTIGIVVETKKAILKNVNSAQNPVLVKTYSYEHYETIVCY